MKDTFYQPEQLSLCFEEVRSKKPLVHCITNYVTVNDVANIVVSSGATVLMADAPEEMEEVVGIAQGLNINTGTPCERTFKAMEIAGKQARKQGSIILLDPVGCGVSEFRTKNIKNIVKTVQPHLIRANATEIESLLENAKNTTGVDAKEEAGLDEKHSMLKKIDQAKRLAKQTGAVIISSGKVDLLTDGDAVVLLGNGTAKMSKIVGTGCQLSALITAFAAANPKELLKAACAAVVCMGLAGEKAEKDLKITTNYIAMKMNMFDQISSMSTSALDEEVKFVEL